MTGRELNPWRQGSLVDPKSALAAGWPGADGVCHMLVATHDCDLQSAAERRIQIIPVRQIDTPDGKCTHGKNPRLLHLPDGFGPESAMAIDLAEKVSVERDTVIALTPQERLGEVDRRLVSGWLGARYSRAPFPDSFDRRLRKAKTVDSTKLVHMNLEQLKKERSLHNELLKVFGAEGVPIEGIYIDISDNTELEPDQSYDAKIAVVAKSGRSLDDDRQIEIAEALARRIRHLFDLATWDNAAGQIVLKACVGTTEKEFSLYQQKKSLRWHLEWLSAEESDYRQ